MNFITFGWLTKTNETTQVETIHQPKIEHRIYAVLNSRGELVKDGLTKSEADQIARHESGRFVISV